LFWRNFQIKVFWCRVKNNAKKGKERGGKMLKKVLVWASIIIFLFPAAAGAWDGFFTDAEEIEVREEEIVPGVIRISLQVTGPEDKQSIQILRVNHRSPDLNLRAALGQDQLTGGLETVRAQAVRADKPGERVVGAINADFFQFDRTASTYGVPLGLHVEQGELIASLMHYPVMGIEAGKVYIEQPRMVTRATSLSSGETREIDAINRTVFWGNLELFTPRFGEKTPQREGVLEIVLSGLERPMAYNTYHTLQVEGEPRSGGGTPLEEGQVVLSASWEGIEFVQSLFPGGQVRIVAAFLPPFQIITDALAGSHYLLQDGQKMELDTRPLVTGRHPRTAVGTNANETMLVTVDGRQDDAYGMNLHELADFFLFLGAKDAINFDGGGSTTMLVSDPENWNLHLANRPSEGRERAVSNALLVTYSFDEKVLPKVEEEREEIEITEERENEKPEERPEPPIIDHWARNRFFDYGVYARTSISLSDHISPGGKETIAFEYTLDAPEGETAAAYLYFVGPMILEEIPPFLGMWVHGDGSGHWLRVETYDPDEQVYRLDAVEESRVYWEGWRYVQFPIPDGIEGPLKVTRIYLAEFRQELMGSGSIYLGPLEVNFDRED